MIVVNLPRLGFRAMCLLEVSAEECHNHKPLPDSGTNAPLPPDISNSRHTVDRKMMSPGPSIERL